MRSRGLAYLLAAPLMLSACGSGGSPPSTPTPTPTPTATQAAFSYNVEPCYAQIVPGTGNMTVRQLIVPDTLKIDFSRPSGFPNGRRLDDQVIDITLAWLFLDLAESGQSPQTFANLPLNPPRNDLPFSDSFPFLAPPQGTPPIAATTGRIFNFRTADDNAYVRVDRMGMPAIATALIGSPLKNPYNDASPSDDVAGTYKADETAQLVNLMNAIGDNLTALGLEICADRI